MPTNTFSMFDVMTMTNFLPSVFVYLPTSKKLASNLMLFRRQTTMSSQDETYERMLVETNFQQQINSTLA